jgi:hypothetical protein
MSTSVVNVFRSQVQIRQGISTDRLIPLSGVAGQTLVAGAGGVSTWSDTFARGKTIDLGTGALPSPLGAGTFPLTLAGVDGSQQVIEAFGFGGAPCLGIRRRAAGGTRAAPTAVPNATAFGYDITSGYDGTAWQNNAAYIGILADATWSGSNRGTMLIWTMTPNGSVTAAEWMRLQNGALTIGGVAATVGNGLLQLAVGTTKANGIAFGTDSFFYRSSAGLLTLENTSSASLKMLSGTSALTLTQVTGNDSTIDYQNAGLLFKTGGNYVAYFYADQSCKFYKNIGLNGNSPPVQPTGFGTPTGTSRLANFPGATATLAQTSGALADLLSYLISRGDLAA